MALHLPAAGAVEAVALRSGACDSRPDLADQLARIRRRRHWDGIESGSVGGLKPAPKVPQTIELGHDLGQPRMLLFGYGRVLVDLLALLLQLDDRGDNFVEIHGCSFQLQIAPVASR